MKKQYTNPNTEISWWVGDNLCAGEQYSLQPPGVPGGNDFGNQMMKNHPASN